MMLEGICDDDRERRNSRMETWSCCTERVMREGKGGCYLGSSPKLWEKICWSRARSPALTAEIRFGETGGLSAGSIGDACYRYRRIYSSSFNVFVFMGRNQKILKAGNDSALQRFSCDSKCRFEAAHGMVQVSVRHMWGMSLAMTWSVIPV